MSTERKPAGPIAILVATITGNIYLLVGSLIFGLGTGLLGLFFPGGRVFRVMGRWWGKSTLWFAGVRLEAEYDEDLGAPGRYILMPNHQSLYDIPALLATLPGETRFLAKQSLFNIPAFGWALKTGGFIPVDRENRKRAGETFRTAIDGLEEGVSVLLFPEETRSSDGQLREFKRGGFLLALRSGLPVVPVGIGGGFAVRPKKSWLIRPGRVKVHYGRAMGSDELSLRDKRQFMGAVRDEVAHLAGLAETSDGQ